MDVLAILALITKGITIANALLEAGESAEPAIKALVGLVTSAKTGVVTNEDLEKTEILLDALITDFNIELPEA